MKRHLHRLHATNFPADQAVHVRVKASRRENNTCTNEQTHVRVYLKVLYVYLIGIHVKAEQSKSRGVSLGLDEPGYNKMQTKLK